MCGILGCISFNNISKKNFNESLNLIHHRGPDNQSVKLFNFKKKKISLGHNRLSIIDLSTKSNQPLSIGKYTIVFNGEIYNYKFIRSKLQKYGIKFNTLGDTEVILQSFIKFGINKTVSLLKGMFAFAIFDGKEGKLFLVRDRAGIKPIYYHQSNKSFIFSSEIKCIKKLLDDRISIDYESSGNFFYHRHVSEPKTIFKNIFAVNSGAILEFHIDSFSLKEKKYWILNPSSKRNNENKILNDIDELLNISVKEHLLSDVPICFAFSGGLDSSLLVAIAKKYKKNIVGYTIDRGKKDIDVFFAKKIANYLKIDHKIIKFSNLDIKKKDQKIFKIYDHPIGCSSIFSTYLLYREISKKFKVCISGDGGDEIFGGYTWYQRFLDLKYPSLSLLTNKTRLKQFIKGKFLLPANDIARYKRIMLHRFEKTEINELLKVKLKNSETEMYERHIRSINSIQDMQYVDFFTFLRFALIRSDLSSMAHSVENRVPFLDHKIIEYLFSINPGLVYKNQELKYLLKKVAERYLPKEFIYREKKGFSAPIQGKLMVNSAKKSMEYLYKQWEYNNYIK